MYYENNRISHRQLRRQVLLSLAGPYLLLVARGTAAAGVGGLAGMAAGFLLLAVWTVLLARRERTRGQTERRWGAGLSRAACLLYLTFLIAAGSCLLRLASRICGSYLVSGIRPEILGILLILAAGIGMGGDVQKRGRLAEFLCPLVVLGFVLMLALAASQIRPEALAAAVPSGREAAAIPAAQVKRREILDGAFLTLCAGAPLGLLPFSLPVVRRGVRSAGTLLGALLALFCLTAAGSVVLLGVFGTGGLAAERDPILLLMGTANLPGGFVERFDSVWMALLVMALLFSLGSLLFCGERVAGCRERSGRRLRLALGALIWLFSVWPGESGRVSAWYGRAVLGLYLPLFVLLPALPGAPGRPWAGKARTAAASLALFLAASLACCLTSCGVEPEKRDYPLALSIDYREGRYQLLYAMADLPVLTGQEKSGEGTGDGESSGEGPVLCEGDSLDAIGERYASTREFQLDTGHVQAVLLGRGLLADPEACAQAVDYLEEDYSMGRQAYVFAADRPEEIMRANGTEKDSIGEYLTGIYDNREVRERTPVTLDDLFFAWYNAGEIPRLPAVARAGEEIFLE